VIRQRLEIKLGQKMVMTPQLQQAIHLLMLSKLDLREEIIQEAQVNPLLELDEDEHWEETPGEDSGLSEGRENQEDLERMDSDPDTSLSAWDPIEENLDDSGLYNEERMIREESENDFSYEKVLASPTTLEDHLKWQLSFRDMTAEERKLADFLIGNLNEDGYLVLSEDEIPRELYASKDFFRTVLSWVQECDPPGVAARDLRECLMIQAKTLGLEKTLVWSILENHLDDFLETKYKNIARSLSVSVEDIQRAGQIIRKMEPKPGRPYFRDVATVISPDVRFYDAGNGEIRVSLNDEGVPRLRIQSSYRSLLKTMEKKDKTREYIENKLKSAMWFMKSIEQRKKTILRVAEAILRYQPDFFHRGPSALRPLVLKTIAQDLGLHESTISRVTNQKYAETPFGLVELKFFFSGSIPSQTGSDHSSVSVREKIREMVRGETPESPLTDQEIMNLLDKLGIVIARRTVAKYRMELDIPPVNKRKREHVV
jgi:RNA polymerase sigma-54 factor